MERDQKVYSTRVQNGVSTAVVICLTERIESNFVGVEYRQILTSFNNSQLTIPNFRALTFQEELRLLYKAASIYKGSREDEKKHIEYMLKEAYGTSATVTLNDIQAK